MTIRTVIFPQPKYRTERLTDEKGKLRLLNKDDVAKELDVFIHMNDIKKEQIVAIDYAIDQYSSIITCHIMLVYEMNDD